MSLTILITVAVAFTLVGLFGARWRHTPDSYIGAPGSLGLWATIATLLASGMGAWLLFGPAETAVTSGYLGLLGYALASGLSLWAFLWLGPRLRTLMPTGRTLPEYVFARYGRGFSLLILFLSLGYMFLAMSAELSGISQASGTVFGLDALPVSITIGIGVMLYTTLGGFRASIVTDKVQTLVIMPLLALITVGVLLLIDLPSAVSSSISTNPTLLSASGWELGLALIIGIVGAELFNQAWWQRVYSAKSLAVMKKGYLIAGIIVIPIVFLAGWLGTLSPSDNPSTAFFDVFASLPSWIGIAIMVLAIALIMSSFDSLLNGMVALFTVDLARLGLHGDRLLGWARSISILLGACAVYVATKGLSVLYLFLLADLLTLAAAVPVFAGMYRSRYGAPLAIGSTLLALIGGLLFFPRPDWSSSLLGLEANLLWSFVLAAAIPLALLPLGRGRFSFPTLKQGTKL